MAEPVGEAPARCRGATPEVAAMAAGRAEEGLLDLARREGWKHAAHDSLRTRDLREYRMAVDEYRGNWRMLLPITRESRVLELNCDYGAASFVLAEATGLIVAVDSRWERVAFTSLRSHEQNVANLRVVQSCPTGPLPFSNGSLDVVAYNGDLKSDSAQTLLSEAHRVLVAGGHIYVATSNRFSLSLAKSQPTNAAAGDGQVSGSGLTPGGLRRLLAKVGFSGTELYAPLPSHELPFFFIPVEDRAALAYYVRRLFEVYDFGADLRRQGLGLVYRAARLGAAVARRLRLTGLGRYVVPSIAAVARK